MSNEAYDQLHKLVAHLMQHGIMSKAKISQVIGMSLIDFLTVFDDLDRTDV